MTYQFKIFAFGFIFAFLGQLFLLLLKKNNSSKIFNRLKRNFLIYSGKSSSNALLLGGLPLAISTLVSFIIFQVSYPLLDRGLHYLMACFIFCSSIVIIYGYLDDRYELRPTAKLMLQVTSVALYALMASVIIDQTVQSILFVCYLFFGLGNLNGANLLDGLDTMTIKLSTINYLAFMWIALQFSTHITFSLAFICIAPLMAFYFFNRYPSKIHLGEIGGSFIGLSYLFLSTCFYLESKGLIPLPQRLFFSLIPNFLPMVELGISFTRRIFAKKSPFRGDSLHIHHLLKNKYKLNVNQTVNYITMFVWGTLSITLFLSFTFSNYVYFFGGLWVFCLTYTYYKIGHHHWFPQERIQISLKKILRALQRPEIEMIENDKIDSFELHFDVQENDRQKAS